MSAVVNGADHSFAVEIRDFLRKPVGQYLMAELKNRRPKVIDVRQQQTVESVAILGAHAEGYDHCMNVFQEISEQRPTPNTPSPYLSDTD